MTVGLLVEIGKDIFNVEEIKNGFVGSSKQFLLVVSKNCIGKNWTKWRAHDNNFNLFYIVLLNQNSTDVASRVGNSVKSSLGMVHEKNSLLY